MCSSGTPRQAGIGPLVLALTLTGMMSTILIAPAVPQLLDDLGQPVAMAGVVIGAGTLPGIVAAPVIGASADRYGRRVVLVPCLVSFGVLGLLAAAAPSFWTLVALRLLQGVSGAGLINLAVVLIGDHWAGAARIRMLGRNTAVMTASVALLAPLGGLLATWGGWRLAFVPYGTALVTAVAAAVLIGPAPGGRTGGAVWQRVAGALWRTREPAVRMPLAIGLSMFVLIFGLAFTALPLHLEQRFDAGAGLAGLLIAISGAAATVVALGSGWVGGRWSMRRVLVVAGVIFTIGYPLLGLGPALALVAAAMLCIGAAEGLLVPALQGALSAATVPSERGVVMSLWGSVVRLGQTIGPLAAGAAVAAVGPSATLWFGGTVLGLVIVWLARRAPWTGPARADRNEAPGEERGSCRSGAM